MGREFELKYAATEAQLALLQGQYPQCAPIAMETTYYDSPDGAFNRLRWTLRRRTENGQSVCTVKIPLPDGSRGEWETEESSIEAAIPILCALGAPKQLLVMAANGLSERCGAQFTRLACTIALKDAKVELALDRGIFLGGGKQQPFAEVEVELKEGSEDTAVRFAEKLARDFDLTPEHRSKVARARALADMK